MTRPFRQFLLLFVLAFVPLMSMASVEPYTDCPKKNKDKGDSLELAEERESIPVTNYSEQETSAEEFIKEESSTNYTSERMSEMDNEDPNSALSFNFVYYIFEKFKFSSAVEPQ